MQIDKDILRDFHYNFDENSWPYSPFGWFANEYGFDEETTQAYLDYDKKEQEKRLSEQRAWKPLTVQQVIDQLSLIEDKSLPVTVEWANAGYVKGVDTIEVKEVGSRSEFSQVFDRGHRDGTKVVFVR